MTTVIPVVPLPRGEWSPEVVAAVEGAIPLFALGAVIVMAVFVWLIERDQRRDR